ncbi:hypothetical protein E6C76_11660 [Pseudothauera nasutitermitis]|uniref:Uncharacterized protein n=1 Tax=Pseudothauera nasutitermitis TaxID=2565930 RepID=A0A4V3WBV3_9RHOO|nr:hypothetical protein [Pseudothauera nasutitermitis]THF64699.1 hypothetical protein E6C76_11660 [Pseudothauera nasutitermitis]
MDEWLARSTTRPQGVPWRREPRWADGLPAAWREQVVAPLDFEVHRDVELSARRVFGRDADGRKCYYAHAWMMTAPCTDDDEEFYLQPTAGESVTAWLLRDERWLVRKVVIGNDGCAPSQPFYVFSESMPR